MILVWMSSPTTVSQVSQSILTLDLGAMDG